MVVLPFYIIQRFYFRIVQFFRHWYIDGFWFFFHGIISAISRLERSIAVRINLHYLFSPLYQDYSIIGFILGFIFRFLRIITGAIIYAFIILLGLFLYALWAGIPVYAVYGMLG